MATFDFFDPGFGYPYGQTPYVKGKTEDKTPSQELNIVHCPDCKYCVKTKDGEYNPDDIVCSYWASDGLESGDFCSYGEKGEYEWCDGGVIFGL